MSTIKEKIFGEILRGLDIPESSYEAAKKRYESLTDWLRRDVSACANFDPHILPQGSFRLGTVVRPISNTEEFDLDVSCRLRRGISRDTHTQEALSSLVKQDLDAYRNAMGIKEEVEPKPRCWRLNYSDHLSFHIDIVPAIPEDESRRGVRALQLKRLAELSVIADRVASHANCITDSNHPSFSKICDDWYDSNTEGYAIWFESRVRLAHAEISRVLSEARRGTMDDLPAYKWRSPLQQAVQVLKRHRDVMFQENPKNKPISVVITTLAARAYCGASTLEGSLDEILAGMARHVNTVAPFVPNPVKPSEDFAEKWADDPELRAGFFTWLRQAQSDLKQIGNLQDSQVIVDAVAAKFAIALDQSRVKSLLPVSSGSAAAYPMVAHNVGSKPAKPWGHS